MSTLERLLAQPPERLLLVAAGVWLLFAIERWRCRGMIRRWCVEQGYELVSMRRSWAVFGRFPFHSDNQVVWRIVADDVRLGKRRRGHARCGGFWSGLWSDQVRVEWQFTREELSDGTDLRPLAPE
jgi:hypothetical protein